MQELEECPRDGGTVGRCILERLAGRVRRRCLGPGPRRGTGEQPQPWAHRPAPDERNFLNLSQRPGRQLLVQIFAPMLPPALVSPASVHLCFMGTYEVAGWHH